jgi:hypothetical protein
VPGSAVHKPTPSTLCCRPYRHRHAAPQPCRWWRTVWR